MCPQSKSNAPNGTLVGSIPPAAYSTVFFNILLDDHMLLLYPVTKQQHNFAFLFLIKSKRKNIRFSFIGILIFI